MVFVLALLFIVIPVAELAILIRLGQLLDFWPTLAIIFGTGIVGAVLAKHQGRRALGAIQSRLARGELPGDAMIDGFLILVAGIVLVTPGLLTDTIGIGLLVPPIRALARGRIQAWFQKKIAQGSVRMAMPGARWGGQPSAWSNGEVIDVTPEEDDE